MDASVVLAPVKRQRWDGHEEAKFSLSVAQRLPSSREPVKRGSLAGPLYPGSSVMALLGKRAWALEQS
eukprot:scaffold645877_cov55-Attheya_sp.AAC.1